MSEVKIEFRLYLWLEYSNNLQRVKVLFSWWINTLNVWGNTINDHASCYAICEYVTVLQSRWPH